mgnify:FL=1
MAGRPKKVVTENTTVENKVETTTKTNTVDNSAEMDSLRKENEELKSQLQMILEKLSTIEEKENTTVSKNETVEDYEDDVETYKEINPLKPIKVVSLSDGGVSLRTNTNGSGKSFRFDKFGHSISITYSDLQDVIAVNRTFIEDGTVYICDADVVKNNYLDEYYNRFLTVEKITNILSFSKSDIIDMVSNTTETIQETIISLIVKKINNNEYVDMNKVEAIGKSCKTPCDIPTLALQKRIK